MKWRCICVQREALDINQAMCMGTVESLRFWLVRELQNELANILAILHICKGTMPNAPTWSISSNIVPEKEIPMITISINSPFPAESAT
jgi:hypothetical protein